MSVSVTVDEQTVTVPEAATVLDAILAAETEIPHLCKDPDQPPIGACRTCLVEIEGMRGFPASCHTPVQPDMTVHTGGETLDRIRQGVLALTRAMLEPGTVAPDEGVGHEFERVLDLFPIEGDLRPKPRRHLDDSNPIFQLNLGTCILCARCTTACEDIQHIGAISIVGTGQNVHIAPFLDQPLIESICTTCGQCVSACPTGALSPRPASTGEREVFEL